MSRVDELTLKLADGTLTPEERRELEALVRGSPEAARAHAAMLDLVSSMRGASPAPDIAAKTLDRIHGRISEKIEIGVLKRIRARGAERAPARVAARRGVPWILALAAAAAVVAGLAVALYSPSRPEGEEGGIAKER